MAFSDHFKEKDKQLALNYLRTMHSELEQTRALANAGELTTAEIHARHAVAMLEQLRTLNNAYRQEAEKVRYTWF